MFTPLQAFKLFFARFSTFQGRSSRSEFWWVMLVFGSVKFTFNIVNNFGAELHIAREIALVLLIAWIFVWFLTLTLSVRRLHDRNMSGTWMLLELIPLIGGLILFVIYCLPSQHKTNQFGADPTVMPWIHYDYYSRGLHKVHDAFS